MRRFRTGALIVMAVLAAACDSPTGPDDSRTFDFEFASGPQDWQPGFADYPQGADAFHELTAAFTMLPPPLGPGRSAWFISGNNHSDDLFMFLTRRVEGLLPRRPYRATFTVEIATDVPAGCGGVGGSPGESVYLKAGASTDEPRTVVDATGHVRMAIDKGNQAQGGANALVLGTIENTIPCEAGRREWQTKTLDSAGAITVRADDDGALWLIVGTDSAFEATTSIYYTRVRATLERSGH